MRTDPRLAALLLSASGIAGLAGDAGAAANCGQEWAVPGEYYVSGNFRGRTESTVIRLSASCRVHFQVPGVFSGSPVQTSGQCVRFKFKVQGQPTTLEANWCGDSGVVPWNGREIRVKVWQSRRQIGESAAH